MIEKSFHIITFGCQMNANDSHWLARRLVARGFVEAPLETARAVLLNTCSVREKPEHKVAATLERVRSLTGGNPDVLVGVLGCVAQQYGSTFFTAQSQVRLIAGSDGISGAPEAVERLLAEPGLRLSLLDFTSRYIEREPVHGGASAPVAYVNIMQGCDNFCAYCIVPFTRGRQKSRCAAPILDECRARLDEGTRELVLLGQNVNAFGRDKSGDGTPFAALLARVAALPGIKRLRYLTSHPKDMRPEDVAAFAVLTPLCPHLHLPLQSGSDTILARMGRKYNSRDFLNIVASLHAARPDMTLSTDIIVGFPGENEDDFQATLAMMDACNFISSFSFCYSDRPGARAALFPNKTAPEIKRDRLLRLQAMQENLSRRWLQGRIGEETCLLVEGKSRRQTVSGQTSWQGRDPYGALVHVALPAGADHTGRMAPVRITEAKNRTLTGRLAGDLW
ncbi:tRNA (N6-isopentenyl adenosine(37)-C2)-methylthiotransferase MiaB [Candidatus Desulfovibrio trichonymphae]|uniref:tRNA-2-methylthio-N(6)-dimethylallyladenosine synthase n=1 Tax=Candidatus Desulfovibrio trichonymphae TaxID=1725232 RepID=A0A1J1E298_9BACT|nr:tRNA (N6-isopentenyl adenosine(37)-C2)-methylthiotransferase MiaB [Candidatus Desulfovibrio trichonymphae]BAV91987.1 tRNA-i(6)A37 methylthiotransferase MiaB [Candidatus Desulfovibrio trichonymphae]GHU99489.1 tRNA-2-methylthio-N(6)-dimethylallyladenosine synthase [Deltaproteobacteria bacterium]